MSKKSKKQSYLTVSDCNRIIKYSEGLLSSLYDYYIHLKCPDYSDYHQRFINLKLLFRSYIESFSDDEDI